MQNKHGITHAIKEQKRKKQYSDNKKYQPTKKKNSITSFLSGLFSETTNVQPEEDGSVWETGTKKTKSKKK